MSNEVNVPEEFLERIPEIPASEQEPGEPTRETYALAVYVYKQVLETGAGEATAVMAAIDNILKPLRSQERQRVREELQAAFDHILNVESKLPGLHDVFDRVFPGWDAAEADSEHSEEGG